MNLRAKTSPVIGENLFPLAAIAGQDKVKLALILLAVNPSIGGVLLVGQKGTAKSTAVRALAEILPGLEAVRGCPFHCDPHDLDAICPSCRDHLEAKGRLETEIIPSPFFTLPLGATEDRIVGGLNLEDALRTGRPTLLPGLLGLANRGFLYVDEVNLLEPYLAHLLLDSVESGRLRVEREGISADHPARAALIGTMNPEEGPLGPQFADRFALTVRVGAETDPGIRVEIVRRRLAYEADPLAFRSIWSEKTDRLAARLARARGLLPRVSIGKPAQNLMSLLIRKYKVRSHRGDLALARAARALAAWESAIAVTPDHVWTVSPLALEARRVEEKEGRVQPTIIEADIKGPSEPYEKPYIPPREPEARPDPAGHEGGDGPLEEKIYLTNETFEVVTPISRRERGPRSASGRRSARGTPKAKGRYYRSTEQRLGRPVALDATFRAAAPHQKKRRRQRSQVLIIEKHDVREKVYRQKTGRLVVFVVDASGSVGSLERMSEAKAAVMSLLADAYIKRDRVGLISFHGAKAEILLPPTNSVETAGRCLEELPTGGKTPMASALLATNSLVRVELARDPGLTPLIVIMTDGRPNVSLTPGVDPWREVLDLAARMSQDSRLRFLLVDTDQGHYNDYKLTRDLAERLGAPRLTLENLRQGQLEAWMEQVT